MKEKISCIKEIKEALDNCENKGFYYDPNSCKKLQKTNL